MALIHTVKIGGVDYDIKSTHYATCASTASTAEKVAIIQNGGFTLEVGARVSIKFTYGNEVAAPTLNVNSTGAKNIMWQGATLPYSCGWKADQVVDFLYDGTHWNMVSSLADSISWNNF